MPNSSRETKFSGANVHREMFISLVQLTTSGIGNLTRLIHNHAICVTIHKYILYKIKIKVASFANFRVCGQSRPNLPQRPPPCRPLNRLRHLLCVSLLSHANRVASTSFTTPAACSTPAISHTDMLQLPTFRRIIPRSYTYVRVQ